MKIIVNRKLLAKNDIIVIAVSGGIDSMVLLHQLNLLKESMNLTLIVAHINHGVREASNEEYEFVKNTAEKYHILFEGVKLDHLSKSNFHNQARTKRYEFFFQVCEKYHAKKLSLAHHLDDQAETILMRLVRGTSFKGYGGMYDSVEENQIKIIRPLLSISKETIQKYQEENLLEYRHDASNDLDDYTRNRYRHHILPVIEKENKQYRSKFIQFTNYIQEANKLVEEMSGRFIKSHLNTHPDFIQFSIQKFNQENRIVRRDILKKSYDIVTHNSSEISFKQMNQLLDILESDKPNAEMELSSGYLAQRSYDSFVMTINSPKETLSESILITHEGEWRYKDTIFTVSTNKPNIISGICLELWYNNLDLIFPLTVRNRVDGDKIITASGTKKIKDLFIDKKIPLKDRDSILIVTDANHQIIWIPEIRTASSIKNGDKVLYLTYKRGQSC